MHEAHPDGSFAEIHQWRAAYVPYYIQQLVVVSGVDGYNASDQKNDQEYEIDIQDQLVIVNEIIIRVCNGHWNHIAYHPVI